MTTHEITIRDGEETLLGDLVVPEQAKGLIVFVHGSGSSRHSPRNRHVAERLQEAGFATLLMDLLSEREEAADVRGATHRFDVARLARRLDVVVQQLGDVADVADLPLGLFGASTGAAAALAYAARASRHVRACVSRGGRPDLAREVLSDVRCPTLLIVGGNDHVVIELNEGALAHLRCEAEMSIIPDAGHLFEEPGALDAVAEQATAWFDRHVHRNALDA